MIFGLKTIMILSGSVSPSSCILMFKLPKKSSLDIVILALIFIGAVFTAVNFLIKQAPDGTASLPKEISEAGFQKYFKNEVFVEPDAVNVRHSYTEIKNQSFWATKSYETQTSIENLKKDYQSYLQSLEGWQEGKISAPSGSNTTMLSAQRGSDLIIVSFSPITAPKNKVDISFISVKPKKNPFSFFVQKARAYHIVNGYLYCYLGPYWPTQENVDSSFTIMATWVAYNLDADRIEYTYTTESPFEFGSVYVTPSTPGTYYYTVFPVASRCDFSQSESVPVTAIQRPPTVDILARDQFGNFSQGPVTIPNNTSTDITWSSENTSSCSVSPNGWPGWPGGVNSTGNLTSGTYTYTANCTGLDGSSKSDEVVVNVSAPPKPSIELSTNSIPALDPGGGNQSYLVANNGDVGSSMRWDFGGPSWVVPGANTSGSGLPGQSFVTADISGNVKQANVGSNSSQISQNCLNLDCINLFRQAAVSLTVPTTSVNLTVNNTSSITVQPGNSVTLAWSSQNPNTSLPNPVTAGPTISSVNFTTNSSSGSVTLSPTKNTIYSLNIRGLSDVDISSANFPGKSATVNVNPVCSPATQTVKRNKEATLNASGGDGATYNWTTKAGDSASPTSGSGVQFKPKYSSIGTKTVTLTSKDAAGNNVSADCAVEVSQDTLGVSLDAVPVSGDVPFTSTITAGVSGTATGNINYNFWWNCPPGVNNGVDVAAAESACGALPAPVAGACVENGAGARCNSMSSATLSRGHTFSSVGSFTPKVIVERDSLFAQDHASTITTFQPAPTASNVKATEPDYCFFGPSVTVSWNYGSPSGSPQLAYQAQVDAEGNSFKNPFDTTKVLSGSTSAVFNNLAFNKNYESRVRVWDSNDLASDWTNQTLCQGPGCSQNGRIWTTPKHAYPQVNFTWAPASPAVSQVVQFTDLTTFFDNAQSKDHSWSWTFGDGGSSIQQNPTHAYGSAGSFNVAETATDKDGYSCTTTPAKVITIKKPVPAWKEVAPKQ